jgi:hypothetical protein
MGITGRLAGEVNAMDSTKSTKKDDFHSEITIYNTALTAPELCEKLGLEINGGKILCPLHHDTHPSAHVYDDHLYCHGCGTYIDPIRLVMETNDCGFRESPFDGSPRKQGCLSRV